MARWADPCDGAWEQVRVHAVWFDSEAYQRYGASHIRQWLDNDGWPAPARILRSKKDRHWVATFGNPRGYRCFRYGAWRKNGTRYMYAGNPNPFMSGTWRDQARGAFWEP